MFEGSKGKGCVAQQGEGTKQTGEHHTLGHGLTTLRKWLLKAGGIGRTEYRLSSEYDKNVLKLIKEMEKNYVSKQEVTNYTLQMSLLCGM